ncbi:SRPBCC domain-containing protein [Streptomyces sp. NPDC000349]|uniref:SRPBCC domain-containing protein n=1 Tax=unclassified Streptomyces TaxID=2593676 RepID=UPI002782350A|nr:SRPBCC domain-containing protein [Streptomyces sp. DSM 40167]MDQ0405216.1 carbon monoxide dehydrogenase subunit G [Streptomyces sp. DSM 40167]
MEHEVFVPVPAERLRDVLADPVRVARAVPGLQQDAGAEPVAGRLKVRIGSHSITYRGSLRLSARPDGTYAVEGDATESRGTGEVTLALTLSVRDAEGGATVVFAGTATADGRVTELSEESVTSATARLLTRFAANLGTAAAEERPPASVFDTEVPPPSLDTEDADEADDTDDTDHTDEVDEGRAAAPQPSATPAAPETSTPETPAPDMVEPPAEAAHARRTMIGRSAEEVDHAPPRGRYAPVPAPQTGVAGAPLRWAAPAAAVVVAGAIVVGRALRKRR